MNRFKNIDEVPLGSLNLEWGHLQISERLSECIKKAFKFDRMTPVQAASIPQMLEGKDVIVEAKTGSGKTLAFLVPTIELILKFDLKKQVDTHQVVAIVLSPTRELSQQIHQELRKILKYPLVTGDRRLVSHLMVGGSTLAEDIRKYDKYGANIIVATPGRLSSLLEMKDNNLSSDIRKNLQILVLDEADQLLSLGFERNLSSILGYLPKQRRTSLFSATQTSEVEDLIKTGMRNPIKINVNKLNAGLSTNKIDCDTLTKKELPMPDKLINYYHVCKSYGHKLATLTEIIRNQEYKKVVVFLSTCSQIDYFAETLRSQLGTDKNKVPIAKFHRRLKNKRKAIFKRFKASKRSILLVTDILSRGIDVPDISCVIHLDLPTSPECYVHRSGRSGHQLDLSGISLLMLEPHELDYVEMCRRRKIIVQEMPLSHLRTSIEDSTLKFVADLKQKSANNPDHAKLGLQAFVSYIRFYSSRMCLRQLLYPKLPIIPLAHGFGLLKLPKMPELKKDFARLNSEFEAASDGTTKLTLQAG